MKRKKVFLLIGQKGSGKSYIGKLFEEEFGIKFIRVEDWAKRIKKDRAVNNEDYIRQVFEEIEVGIRNELEANDRVVFESTGLTEFFDKMLSNLKSDFEVVTIGVFAESKLCLERVRTRDQSIHINVSDEQVTMINQKVIEKNMKTDFKILNNDENDDLLEQIKNIVKMELKS